MDRTLATRRLADLRQQINNFILSDEKNAIISDIATAWLTFLRMTGQCPAIHASRSSVVSACASRRKTSSHSVFKMSGLDSRRL